MPGIQLCREGRAVHVHVASSAARREGEREGGGTGVGEVEQTTKYIRSVRAHVVVCLATFVIV